MARRTILIGAGVVAVVAGLSIWAFRPQPALVEVREVVVGPFEQTVDEEGKTRVRDRYMISAPVAGRLERIALKSGDALRAGDVVAVLRPAPPALQDARTMSELREQVGAAEASNARAEANVQRLKAAVEQARFDLERVQRLAAQNFVSKSAEDQARLTLAQQQQALKAAEFERHAAEHQLALARATLAQGDRAARGQAPVARIELRTPVAGSVLRVPQESEAVVAVGAPLVEVGDPGSLEAVIDILSQEAPRVAPGMPVRMTVSSAAPPVTGRVRRVEPSARTKISTLGVEEQRVAVVVDLDPPPPGLALGDGYRVDAQIVVLARPSETTVPVGALFRDGAGWAAFVVADGRARRRAVEVAGRNQHEAWVAGGLAPGERIIVYPPDTVRDGVRVRQRSG